MSSDLNNFYSSLQNDLSPNASSLGGIIVAVAFLQAISVFFILIAILRYTGDEKKSNEAHSEDAKNIN